MCFGGGTCYAGDFDCIARGEAGTWYREYLDRMSDGEYHVSVTNIARTTVLGMVSPPHHICSTAQGPELSRVVPPQRKNQITHTSTWYDERRDYMADVARTNTCLVCDPPTG